MISRAINNSTFAQSEIGPTTLVFGIYPKILEGDEPGSVLKRSQIIRDCTEFMTNKKSQRKICDTIRSRINPSLHNTEKASNVPQGHDLQVYREIYGSPRTKLLYIRRIEADVILPSGKISTLAINIMRPCYKGTCEQTKEMIKARLS